MRQSATANMIDVLGDLHGLDRTDAYLLCSVFADLRISEVVIHPNWVVSLCFPKIIFK